MTCLSPLKQGCASHGTKLAIREIRGLHVAMNVSASVAKVVGVLSWYLRLNPLASDTLEGIAQWWLKTDDVSLSDLTSALEQMKQAGVIEVTNAADGQVRYRRTGLNARVDERLDRFIAGS
jgi:hypothetical protein